MKKFTLIELLMVITLIAILLSLLLPSLRDSREKACQAVCLSNFGQMTKALYGFTKVSNGKLPGPLTWLQSSSYSIHSSSLAGELAPFMNLPEAQSSSETLVNPLFLCPSFKVGVNGSLDQSKLTLFRSGGRGGARYSGKHGYFGLSSDDHFGYSSLVVLKNGDIGILAERARKKGENGVLADIVFHRIQVNP